RGAPVPGPGRTDPVQVADGDAAAARVDRAEGALLGLAIGDALGMPTQYLPRGTVTDLYGGLRWFEPGPEANEISRGLPAGHVTDDTDQALVVARALVAGGGHVKPDRLARDLLAWEAHMVAADSLDLLGPSTKRALTALANGADPTETGRWGDTNGAAMRIAPVGVLVPPLPLDRLVDRVTEVCALTHNTGVAIAGAAAVAAAVSTGVDGGTFDDALDAAVLAARQGARRGSYVAGADVATRIVWAVDVVRAATSEAAALDAVSYLVGTGIATQESVPAAFALLALWPLDPWRVCLAAANLGGDSDTVGAMAGAVGGALNGAGAFPREAVTLVTTGNDLDVAPLVGALLALRGAP
ncbi:MAG: ADP-ribosylglycohydrolase family protein, partial [Janthinobacterium lividum]